MKLLIADDDEIIRKTFIEKIPWEENGFEVVGVAQNGLQAYELALYTCPDIILSDIEMPFINGLKLAQKLQQVLENCRFIFLTAYDNFDYAKEAIRLHAYEYILKDSRESEILEVVLRAAGEIRIRNRNTQLTNLGKEQLEKNRIFRLLHDNIEDEEKKIICRDMGIEPDIFQYQVVVLKVSEAPQTAYRRPSENAASENELKEILKEDLKRWKGRYWLSTWSQYQVLFFEIMDRQKGDYNLTGKIEAMVKAFEGRLADMVTAGMGRICSGEVSFSNSFDDAVFAVNDDSQERVRFYRELGQSNVIREIREYILQNYSDPELSLNKLSEQVYLNPTYISSLFKRYMNSNFKEYLINLRMKEACRLLEHTDLMSYEISAMTGYPNPQYFSVLFKKYTGETPTQYHNRFHREYN